MKIPYGVCDFARIRRKSLFYADKTPFLPVLESAELGLNHLVFLRPRRFGKSTLVSMLEHYYDVVHKERFDELFGGLWIHEHPTPERNSHLVLNLDFSGVATGGGPELLEQSFLESVRERVAAWIFTHRGVAPELDWLAGEIGGYRSPEAVMGGVLSAVQRTGYKLYLIVDEYDHFANRLLSVEGEALYDETVVKRTGFVRTFYAKLKSGTQTGALARMFVTGVTPLLLDDLSSGFNISTNISTSARFNTLAGFTRAEVERAVDEFLAARPHLASKLEIADRDQLLETLVVHYNGYRFSPDATERVFNSDMVLYFLKIVADRERYPRNMLDRNVRTDYRQLQRIGTLTGEKVTERRALLERILSEGHIRSELVEQFGVRSLTSHAPFISLLCYLGMLTLRYEPEGADGDDMEIPNRVIRQLQWEHLSLMLQEQAQITVEVEELQAALGAMAVGGDIAPFLDVFHSQVIQAFGLKDTRGLDEKTIKLLFMTYASIGRVFYPLSEKEFAQGYCDLFLGASVTVPSARFSWLIEFKYLKAGAKPGEIEAAFTAAAQQVAQYASDAALIPLLVGKRELRAGMIVFVGTKKVQFRPWPAPAEAAPEAAPAKKAAPAKRAAPAKNAAPAKKGRAATKRGAATSPKRGGAKRTPAPRRKKV